MADPSTVPSPRPREILGGIELPKTSDPRAQVALMERMADLFQTVARVLRRFDLHVAATGLEYASQDLLGECERQRGFLAMREPRP